MEKIRVLVADDNSAFREGLCRFLEDEEDLEVVAKLADGQETVSLEHERNGSFSDSRCRPRILCALRHIGTDRRPTWCGT